MARKLIMAPKYGRCIIFAELQKKISGSKINKIALPTSCFQKQHKF